MLFQLSQCMHIAYILATIMASDERTYCSYCHDEITDNETICEICKKDTRVLSSPTEITSNVKESQDDKEPTPVLSPSMIKLLSSPGRKHRPPKPPKPTFEPDQPTSVAGKIQKFESLRRIQHQGNIYLHFRTIIKYKSTHCRIVCQT